MEKKNALRKWTRKVVPLSPLAGQKSKIQVSL